MFKSYFTAREDLDTALDDGDLDLTGPQCAVLRYLVEHAVFRGAEYGWVMRSALGTGTIAKRTAFGERAVRSAINGLEDKGLITRKQRPMAAGGRMPALIRVNALFDDEPNRHETPLREPARGAAYEPAPDAGSFLISPELLVEPATKGDSDV